MALTNQPYLPLYVNDWMNNNKLKSCSPSAHGVMISVMCLMHKEITYGKILLKQKYKQTDNQIKNFALQVARLTAFDLVEVEPAIFELVDEGVLHLDGDYLVCDRMVRDAEISAKRALAGKNGGQHMKKIAPDFAQANQQANTENAIEYINTNSSIENDSKEDKTLTIVKEAEGKKKEVTDEFAWSTKPNGAQLNLPLPEIKYGGVIELFKFAKNSDITRAQVEQLWKHFKVRTFDGVKYYPTPEDAVSHFFNWLQNPNVTIKTTTHGATDKQFANSGKHQPNSRSDDKTNSIINFGLGNKTGGQR